MKRLLNTLYITTHGAWLSREGDCIVVRVEHEEKLRVPVIGLEGIVCMAGVGFSPPLMGLCTEHGVGVSFLTESGEFLARVSGPVSGNVLLRRQQYRAADDETKTRTIVRSFALGKIVNARTVLMRAARDQNDEAVSTRLTTCADRLQRIAGAIEESMTPDIIRGKEGEAGFAYFSVFDDLIVARKDEFRFTGRSRRPPMDPINALLSFAYTLLAHDAQGALEAVGLDPQVGFLHRERPGRPSLALDLMEEFRPVIADRLVLSLVNRQQLGAKDFERSEGGGVFLRKDSRKIVLKEYQERKRDEVHHPFIDEKIAIGLLPHVQARLLARHLRGDIDGYPPYFWK
jgi:CRISPR-associated protein Cas1